MILMIIFLLEILLENTEDFSVNFRVDRSLPCLQDEVRVLCYRLLSRRCHNISSMSRLIS